MTEQEYIASGLALVHLQRCIQVTGLVKISFYSRRSVFSWYQPTSVLFPLFMLVLSVMCRLGSRSCFPYHNSFKFIYFCHPSSPQSWPWCTPKVSLKRHLLQGMSSSVVCLSCPLHPPPLCGDSGAHYSVCSLSHILPACLNILGCLSLVCSWMLPLIRNNKKKLIIGLVHGINIKQLDDNKLFVKFHQFQK